MNQELYDHIIIQGYQTADVDSLHTTLADELVVTRQPALTKNLAQRADEIKATPELIKASRKAELHANAEINEGLHITVAWALMLIQAKYDDFSMETENFAMGMGLLEYYGILTPEQCDALWELSFVRTLRWPGLTKQNVQAALDWPQIEALRTQYASLMEQASAIQTQIMLLEQGTPEPVAEAV